MQPNTPISAFQDIVRDRRRRPLHISPSKPGQTDKNTPPLRPMAGSNEQIMRQVKAPLASWTIDDKSGGSEGPTIRGIRTAFAETPIRLRELEVGWREKRRAGLVDRKLNGVIGVNRDGRRVVKGSSPEGYGSRKKNVEINGMSELDEGVIDLKAERQMRVSDAQIGRQRSNRRDVTFARSIEEDEAKYTSHKVPPSRQNTNPLAPPSPPLTPPLIPDRLSPYRPDTDKSTPIVRPGKVQRPKRVIALPTTDDEQSCTVLIPILSSPLPPTPHHVPLSKRSRDTIHVHPSPSNTGITLNVNGSEIRVSSEGTTVSFWSNGRKGMMLDRVLELGLAKKWSEGDKRDWELVTRLVEGYKRHIPKVRLYLPLGHILITCCSPPDVILSFDFTVTQPQVRSNRKATGLHASTTKVKVRLSRINSGIIIDTASVPRSGERLRTRRSILIDLDKAEDGVSDLASLMDALRDILRFTDDWLEAEEEGLRRLIELKEEWERYG